MPNNFPNITIEQLKLALKKPLPGEKAHLRMLPKGRKLTHTENDSSIKKSAVLMLLYPENNELFFCLTKRNLKLRHHPGQISFPGGRCEKHETDPWLTALRETEEEVGLNRDQIQFVGRLSDVYVSVSNFNIHPYIGYSRKKPTFVVNDDEVDELICLPLHSIFLEKNHSKRKLKTRQGTYEVPCYVINENIIWGATSMMIAELEVLLTQHYSHRAER